MLKPVTIILMVLCLSACGEGYIKPRSDTPVVKYKHDKDWLYVQSEPVESWFNSPAPEESTEQTEQE